MNKGPWFFITKDFDKKLFTVQIAYGVEEEKLTQAVAAEQKKNREIRCDAIEIEKTTLNDIVTNQTNQGLTLSKELLF